MSTPRTCQAPDPAPSRGVPGCTDAPAAPVAAAATPSPVLDGDHLRSLFDHHPSAVLLLDAQGRIVDANAALHTRFGHEPDRVRGRMLSALMPDWDQPGLLADLMQRHQPLEATLRHAQGRRCEVMVSLLPAAAQQRTAGAGFFLIARDVSVQRRLQRQMQVQVEILSRLNEAVVVLDERGDVVCWKAGATRLYGVTVAAMAGQPFVQLFEAPHRPRLQQGLADAALDAATPIELELPRIDAHGHEALLRLSLSRIAGVEPGHELCLVLGHVITSRAQPAGVHGNASESRGAERSQ